MDEYFGKQEPEQKKVKKKKPIDIRDVAAKTLKDYKKDEEYQQNLKAIKQEERFRRYSKSRSGTVARGITRTFAFVRNPARSTYRQPLPPSRYSRVQRAKAALINASNAAVMQPSQNQAFYNWAFSNFDVAQPIEREISRKSGYSGEGSKASSRVGAEAKFIAETMTFNPIVSTSMQTNHHARKAHIKPVIDVEDETLSYANILP